jgi:two-component system, chemotaxis family, chemotaxis protein CheY
VASTHPALVLLDMRMPVLDGWGVARAVESYRGEFKILVMTAAENAEAWCQQIRGDGCLPKPFALDHLLAEAHRLCTPPQ